MANHKSVLAALAITLIPATQLFAQAPPPPPAGVAPPPVYGQVPPPPPPGVAPPPAYGTTAAPVAAGRIARFLINPNGDVDGLLLADGTQANFPPHLSAALMQIARVGDTVSVQGFRGYGADTVHATVITNTSTNQSMVDQPPSPDRPPPPPAALNALNVTSRVVRLLHADMGELNGAILEDGTIVRFPPPFGAQLQTALRPNVELTATGYGTQNAYGRALEATSLAIDGQAPITVYGPGTMPPGPGFAPRPR
jgi:hypothetical protein